MCIYVCGSCRHILIVSIDDEDRAHRATLPPQRTIAAVVAAHHHRCPPPHEYVCGHIFKYKQKEDVSATNKQTSRQATIQTKMVTFPMRLHYPRNYYHYDIAMMSKTISSGVVTTKEV